MADLIIGSHNVTEMLKQTYTDLEDGWLTLIQLPPQTTMAVNIEAIKTLQTMDAGGIYLTLSQSCSQLLPRLQKAGVDTGKILFIDGISRMQGAKELEEPNVTYVAGPLAIDEMTNNIHTLAPKITGDRKYLFLDSITTVMLYNSLETTLKFSQFIQDITKQMQLVGIVASISNQVAHNELIEELSKLANKVICLEEPSS